MRTLLFLLIAIAAHASNNILLIIADDYGVDSSSLYNSTSGASLPPTPTIASLVANGVRFLNAYANPVCSPTRACLLTGRHAFRTGVGDVVDTSTVFPTNEFTLPDAFAAHPELGYSVAQFGKWHLGNGSNGPATAGRWPSYAGCLVGALNDYRAWTKTINGVTGAANGTTTYATTDVTNDAIAWIQARGTTPWFAWVAYNAPHTPFHKPPANLHSYSLTGLNINTNQRVHYEASVEAMDTEISRLLASVDLAKTNVIFMGDNGTPGTVIQAPYTTPHAKDTLYEGGTKVPFIIRGPAVVSPGRTSAANVNVVDVFSTILDLAGISYASPTLDSRSLLPILQNSSDSTRYGYSEMFGANIPTSTGGQAIRNTQYKLIRFQNGTEEFYELSTDANETSNLLAGTLTAAQQANYYSLALRLANYQSSLASPTVSSLLMDGAYSVTVSRDSVLTYTLWRSSDLSELSWAPIANAQQTSTSTTVTLSDPTPLATRAYYKVLASTTATPSAPAVATSKTLLAARKAIRAARQKKR